jgi:FkbM family methyltransferase
MIQKHCELLKTLKLNPKTILEIGSRDGNDANYYASQFNIDPKSVYVVEPNPEMIKGIKQKYPDFNLFEVAIDSGEETYKEFNQVKEGGQDPIGVSSLLNRNDGFYDKFLTSKINVKTINASTLMKDINTEIDICKIDVEGLTYDVIESFSDTISKVKTIHVETEELEYWENQKLEDDVFKLLESLNFEMIWKGNSIDHQSDSIWINKAIIEKVFTDLEIHTLICKKDILLAINNIKSFRKYDIFKNIPIYLHDDGSLDENDFIILNEYENIIIIKRSDADEEIKQYIANHPYCLQYRLGDGHINLWHKIKLFDYFYFSKSKKIIGMDTDLLFLRYPKDVIEYVISNTPFYFPDIQSAYCFNEPKDEITRFENVNTGLIFIPSEEYYNIDSIENALSNLVKNNINYFPSWIEQSAFAHMFYIDGRYKSLDINKYRVPYFQNVEVDIAECLHFVSYPAVRETYDLYMDYINLDSGELFYGKDFIVKYNDIDIPLTVKLYNSNKLIKLEYYWGLETTNQQFLDHEFKVTSDDKVFNNTFSSSKTGFMIINPQSDIIIIEHTYDWYGNKNWELLDTINLSQIS